MPKPASTSTLSLTTSSWAMRRVVSGTPPSSLTMTSTLRPATVVPFCACQSLIAASICLPVDADWPVMGRMKPILNGALFCACAVAVSAAATPSAVRVERSAWRRFMNGPSSSGDGRFCRDARPTAPSGHSLTAPMRLPIMARSGPAAPTRRRHDAPAPARRFAPTTSAASCAPSACSRRASSKARGEITPEALRAVEDDAIAEIVKFQEDVGLQQHHRRRVPPHLLPHRLPRAARRRQDRHPGHDQQARRQRGARAAGDARDRQGAPRQGHPARRLRVPEVAGQRRPHAEGDDPVADDAALPRRPRRHQPRALPGPRAVLRGRRRRLRRRAALARRRRLHLRADGRHQPRLPVRRQDARGGALARRRPRRAAAPLRDVHQPRRRAEARRA